MRKLYEKSELTFTIVWIVVYCVLQSLANPLNEKIGVEYSASAIFSILQSVILLVFIRKNNLLKRYGLCKSPISASRFLCYIACMLWVGFLEEVIFRGLLFKAIAKDNVKTAIIISSVTFGLGHLLNLVNGSGAGIAENLLQVTGAIAIGFLFVILYYRGGSLFPCIITHSAINITSVFANVVGLTIEKRIIFQLVLFAITITYSFILTKTLPKNQYYDREDN